MVFTINSNYFQNSIKQSIFVVLKCVVLFDVKYYLNELRHQKIKGGIVNWINCDTSGKFSVMSGIFVLTTAD